ncbi:hypothetical protein KKD70_04590 [Patescibacteria group bacterium]|nr:hypothetical protein [Patescibacteria group bacterium]
MRKALISIFGIMLLVTFTACGQDQGSNPTNNDENQVIQEDAQEEGDIDQEMPDEEGDEGDMLPPEEGDEGDIDQDIGEESEITEESNQPTEAKTIEEIVLEDGMYIGVWSRISSTLDGVPQEAVSSTIKMSKSQYIASTSYCTVVGDLYVTGDTMDIMITQNGCAGGGPTNYVFAFRIDDERETLTLTNTQFGGTMIEVYKFDKDLEIDEFATMEKDSE